jgi:putative ABC transport system ATP-binding protein
MTAVLPREAARAVAPPGIAAETIIEARDVVKTYDSGDVQVQALRGVSLVVPKGEMVAIMGPSGCGKTTLLNCMSGLDAIDGGIIKIAGVDINSLSDNAKTEYRARRMGFVFQFYNLLPVLSSVENVELPLVVSGVKARDARARALHALDLVGLAARAQHRPAQLSGGERQRVTIARALANDPAIVWADEPTGDLDSKNADEIMALMERLNQEHGLTFVIVTHDISIGRRAHRIVRMLDGRIVDEVYPEHPTRVATGTGTR